MTEFNDLALCMMPVFSKILQQLVHIAIEQTVIYKGKIISTKIRYSFWKKWWGSVTGHDYLTSKSMEANWTDLKVDVSNILLISFHFDTTALVKSPCSRYIKGYSL